MSRNSLSAIEFRNRQNKFLNLTWEEIGNYRILHLTQNVGRNYFWVYLIQDVFVPALYQIFLWSNVLLWIQNLAFDVKKLIFTMILICILKRITGRYSGRIRPPPPGGGIQGNFSKTGKIWNWNSRAICRFSCIF